MKSKIAIIFALEIIAVCFSFPAQTKKIFPFARIFFEIKSGYLVFSIPIEPSGSLSFLFDTGCQTMNVTEKALARIKGKQGITLLLGTQKLKIDNYRINQSTALSEVFDKKIDGVIGNDILHRYAVKIDYKNRVLSLFDSEEFVTYPNSDEVAIDVNSLVSSVPLKITFPGGQQVEGEFMIDTGAPINLLINTPAAEQNGLYTILEKKKERKFKTLADVQTAVTAMAESVKIGKFECEDMEIYISTSKKGLFTATKYAGIVGNKFFQNFNVIFDYKKKRLYIEKH